MSRATRIVLLVVTTALPALTWATPRASAQEAERSETRTSEQAPEPESHEESRLMFSAEGALLFALSKPERDRFHPGGTLSVASHFSLFKWLMPLARVRAGFLSAGSMPDARDGGLGHVGTLSLGVRFRPRGIAHPEEPSRASCIWAELDAGLSLWNGDFTASFEGAVGFTFLAPKLDFGPVVRFIHILPAGPTDGANVLLMTVGVEVLINDAR